MGYNSQMIERANAELSARRNNALVQRQNRIDEITAKLPQIAELRLELAQTGMKLARLISSRTPNIDVEVDKLQEQNLDNQRRIAATLEANGYPYDYLDLKASCEKCGDHGVIGNRRCECFEKLLKRSASAELSESAPITSCTFKNFDLSYYPDSLDSKLGIVAKEKMTDIFNYCKAYARTFTSNSASIFMYGKTGLGKTHLSLAIAGEVVAKGYSVIYASAQDILRKVEREHFGRGQADLDTLGTILSTDLLIIDDLGSEFESSFYISAVYNIINNRLNRRLPTIISSNLSSAELEKRYTDRVVSRLRSMYYNLCFVGNDIRQIKAVKQMRG